MRNPLTIEAFAAWCGTNPAGEEYPYSDCNRCAFAEYLLWVGFADPAVGTKLYRDSPTGKDHLLPAGVDAAVRVQPHTYGALAARLRASA